jgi:hypothetical protein
MPDVYAECSGQGQEKEGALGTGDEPQHVPSSSGSATHMGENEELVITSMTLISLHRLQRLLMTW